MCQFLYEEKTQGLKEKKFVIIHTYIILSIWKFNRKLKFKKLNLFKNIHVSRSGILWTGETLVTLRRYIKFYKFIEGDSRLKGKTLKAGSTTNILSIENQGHKQLIQSKIQGHHSKPNFYSQLYFLRKYCNNIFNTLTLLSENCHGIKRSVGNGHYSCSSNTPHNSESS